MKPFTRCPHCGGEYSAEYPSHCMANFHEGARRTELLGRYVTRAEKAEATVAKFVAAIGRMSKRELDSLKDDEAFVGILEAYIEGRRPTSDPPVKP